MPDLADQRPGPEDVDGGGDIRHATLGYNPFVLTDILWTNKSETPQTTEIFEQHDLHIPYLNFDLPHHDTNNNLPSPLQLPHLDLNSLSSFDKPKDDLDSSVLSLSASESNIDLSGQPHLTLDEDICSIDCQAPPLDNDTKLLSWQALTTSQNRNIKALYISEAGDVAFDAALQLQAGSSRGLVKAGTVVQSDVLLQCLWQLALGRPSTLFPTTEESFGQAVYGQRLSGCSLDVCDSLFREVLALGTGLVQLRSFKDRIFNSPETLPSLIALSSALDVIVSGIDLYIVQHQQKIATLLQLQSLVTPAYAIVNVARQLVDAANGAQSDAQVLSKIFEACQHLQDCDHPTSLLFAILRRVCRPWLEHTTNYLRATSTSPTGSLDSPSFVSAGDVSLIDNIRHCSVFLQSFHSCHAPGNIQGEGIAALLEVAFTYEDIDRINTKAQRLQKHLSTMLSTSEAVPTAESAATSNEAPETAARSTPKAFDWNLDLEESSMYLSTLQTDITPTSSNDIHDIVSSYLSGAQEDQLLMHPPISLAPHLSLHPFLVAQSAMLTTMSLRSIVVDHHLLAHLNVLQQFFLCGSGVFTSRLRMALFSSDVEAAERTKGVIRTGARGMGLKLGSGERREWPPASSELTLALMGVLDESWRSLSQSRKPDYAEETGSSGGDLPEMTSAQLLNTDRNQPLPGSLSFAIRTNLTEGEIEKTLDAHRIFALDFLCLSYNPSVALSEVITTSKLERYDKIFRLLLQMMRMQFVAEELHRDIVISHRPHHSLRKQQDRLVHAFRHRATHVITSLSSYFHEAISSNMSSFYEYISLLETQLAQQDGHLTQKEIQVTPTALSFLAELHSRCLSKIMTCLLQRERQHKAAALLEDMMDCILAFALAVRGNHGFSTNTNADQQIPELKQLYTRFNSALKNFQTVVTEMCIKMESSESSARKVVAADQKSGGAAKIAEPDGMQAASSLRELLAILDIPNS